MLNEILKRSKNISADIKAYVNEQEIRELVAVSCHFSQNCRQQVCNFHLSVVGIPSNLILSVKNIGCEGT